MNMHFPTSDTRPRRRPRILKQGAETMIVLLNIENGQYYSLEEPGDRIWNWCDGRHTVAAMVDILACEYDRSAAELERDLMELLADMAHEKLVELPAQ